MVMRLNVILNNISVISWRSVLLVEEKTADLPQVTDKLHHILLYLIDIRVSVISQKTLHVKKTKLHVSLDRALRGNKYHVSRCRVPPWRRRHKN
jgi:hypothetical protein